MALLTDLKGRQLSWLELSLCVIVVALAVGYAADRIDRIRAQVEAQKVSTLISRLSTGLRLELAAKLMTGGAVDYEALARTNPMRLGEVQEVEGLPVVSTGRSFVPYTGQYLGEFTRPDLNEMTPGGWYFDRENAHLVYMVESADYVDTPLAGPKRLRFKVEIDYRDDNKTGRFESRHDHFLGFRIVSVEPFKWNIK